MSLLSSSWEAELECSRECAEIGRGGGLDDSETRLQNLLREKARPIFVSDQTLDAWFGCDERAPRCAGAAMSRALLNTIRDWPALRVACVMLSCVRPGKSLSRDRCRPLFLQDCGREPAGCG